MSSASSSICGEIRSAAESPVHDAQQLSQEPIKQDSELAEEADKLCRLCPHGVADKGIEDIFEQGVDGRKNEETPLAKEMQAIFGLEIKRHDLLPKAICEECLQIFKQVMEYKEHVQQSEAQLMASLTKRLQRDIRYRPGVNGNEGEFEADEYCEVIDIDPFEDIISSDDDFSLDSNSDADFFEDDEDEDDEIKNSGSSGRAAQGVANADLSFGSSNDVANFMEPSPIGDDFDVNGQPRTAYVCQYCDMAFINYEICRDHEAKEHDSALPYNCNFCPERYQNRQTLIYHIRGQHDSNRPYVCPRCSKGFCRRSDLKKHTVVHTGVRPFTCNICSKSFSRNTNLTKHMRIHSSVKPHVCKFCPRSFQTVEDLMRHTPTHNEIKPYQCTRCPSSFSRRDKLQVHESMHAKRDAENSLQKPNIYGTFGDNIRTSHDSIDDSDNSFYRSSILANQLQQPQQAGLTVGTSLSLARPAQLRNYKCHICEKTFQRPYDLQRHQALHLDELFTCKLCGQSFNRVEKLTRHEMEEHTPRFRCDLCFVMFLRLEDLREHEKIHSQLPIRSTDVNQQGIEQQLSAAIPNDSLPLANNTSAMYLGFYNESHPEELIRN